MHFLVVRDLIESAECQSETLSKIHEVRMTGSVCLLRLMMQNLQERG